MKEAIELVHLRTSGLDCPKCKSKNLYRSLYADHTWLEHCLSCGYVSPIKLDYRAKKRY